MAAQDKVGRNDPCPCGSGKKYKHCCLLTRPLQEDTLWSKQHDAFLQLNSVLMTFSLDRFHSLVDEAWLDFHLGDDGGVSMDSDEMMIFMPYFLFHWDPEFSSRKKNPRSGGVVIRAFLRERGYTLSDLQRTIVEQNTIRPFSFFRILAGIPGERLSLEDVLTGARFEAVERSASRTLQSGDVIYGAVSELPGITVLGCCAPVAVPPDRMADIIKLRKKLRNRIAKQHRELTEQDLHRYADDVRETYVDIRDSLRRPPRLTNTDGDWLELKTLTFRIESPNAAFRALAPLAYATHSLEDLLADAEFGADGTVCRVEIPWSRKGNRKMSTWDNTILGRIQIDGNSLVAEVNSLERAERLCAEINKRLGGGAVHQSTTSLDQDDLMRRAGAKRRAHDPKSAESEPRLDPEVQRHAQEMMQKEAEAWVHKRVPLLGRRTPLQAVQDPDGREIVESLLLGWERKNANLPEIMRKDIGVLRRLLGLNSSTPD